MSKALESEILDSAKNTTEAKFHLYKQIHAESTLLRAFLILCDKLAFTVLAFIFVPVKLNDLDPGCQRDLLDNLIFNVTLKLALLQRSHCSAETSTTLSGSGVGMIVLMAIWSTTPL